MKKPVSFIIIVFAFFHFAENSYATSINLVENGEFELPVTTVDSSQLEAIPGWETTDTAFEIWTQGKLQSPETGSDGINTGQHYEIHSLQLGGTVTASQSFTVPDLINTVAKFRFDAWLRDVGSGTYKVEGSLSGELVPNTAILANQNSWINNEVSFDVFSGEIITIFFSGDQTASDSRGIHIDQVEFIVDSPQSKPQIEVKGGYIKLDVTSGNPPPALDCANASHNGRIVIDEIYGSMYICTNQGWITK